MKIIKIRFLILCFSVVFILLLPQAVKAARFYFENGTLSKNSLLQVILRLDSEGEEINALEGKIILPPSLVVTDIDKDNSIIPLWIKEPQRSGREISFAGIIPGGIVTSQGPILTLKLKAFVDKPSQATFNLDDFQVLLNDGKGTKTNASAQPLSLLVYPNQQAEEYKSGIATDHTPPGQFIYQVIRDANLFNNKWVVIFLAQDKESGIAYYEIQENREEVIDKDKWLRAKSPYLLQDQSRQSYIFLKAVDKAGNYTLAAIEPLIRKRWYESQTFLFILISGGVILAGLLLVIIFRSRKLW